MPYPHALTHLRTRLRNLQKRTLFTLSLLLSFAVLTPIAIAAAPIENLAGYASQTKCDPVAKPGTLALRSMFLRKFGGGDLGIVRSCSIGGASEHKEGRAWDWSLNANSAADRKRANQAIRWMLSTDAAGNRYAKARRLGVMYIIWNRKIWRAYDPARGWDTYTGSSPHTDHMHISLSWAGALKQTSFWTNRSGSGTATTATPPPSTDSTREWTAVRGYYTARKGDTVRKIARGFDKRPRQIRRWNGWPRAGKVGLYVGKQVRVKRPPRITTPDVSTPDVSTPDSGTDTRWDRDWNWDREDWDRWRDSTEDRDWNWDQWRDSDNDGDWNWDRERRRYSSR